MMILLSMLSSMSWTCCSNMDGCPAIQLDLEEVKYLLAFNFNLEDIAALLDVSRLTLFPGHSSIVSIQQALLYAILQP